MKNYLRVALSAAMLSIAAMAAAESKCCGEKGVLSYLPITTQQACDESTLDLKITSESEYQHPDFPDQKLRGLSVTFFQP